MNEPFQYIQPGAAGLTQGLPASHNFPRMPRWLGQILPAPRFGAVSPPSRRGAPLPRFLAPVAPQVDRSPPVASLPDRPPGRGEAQQMLETGSNKRVMHRDIVINTQFQARRYGIPLPTAPAHPARNILPLAPVLPALRGWRIIPGQSRAALHQPASDAQPLPAQSQFRGQAASSNIVPSRPAHAQGELEDDGHREYSIDLAR